MPLIFFSPPSSDIYSILSRFQYDEDAVFTHFWRHLLAMINKRRLYFMRDTRSWIFQYIVPVLFVLVGMLVMRVSAGTYSAP